MSVFRLAPSGLPDVQAEEELNDLNRAYYARLSSRSDILLTQTKLNGTFCIRFAVGAARTTKAHIDKAWETLQEEAGVALKEWEENRTNGEAIP